MLRWIKMPLWFTPMIKVKILAALSICLFFSQCAGIANMGVGAERRNYQKRKTGGNDPTCEALAIRTIELSKFDYPDVAKVSIRTFKKNTDFSELIDSFNVYSRDKIYDDGFRKLIVRRKHHLNSNVDFEVVIHDSVYKISGINVVKLEKSFGSKYCAMGPHYIDGRRQAGSLFRITDREYLRKQQQNPDPTERGENEH